MMRELTTKITSADPRQTVKVGEAMQRNLKSVRSKSSPEIAVISNFDPDHQGFLTDTMKGYTLLQQPVGAATVGRLAVNGDYGVIPPGGTKPLKQQPGKPNLIYPVAGGSASASLSYIKGGKVDTIRTYPYLYPIRNHRSYIHGELGDFSSSYYDQSETIVVNPTVNFILPDFGPTWSDNSPLPPGARYVELNDIASEAFGIFLRSRGFIALVGKTKYDFGLPPPSGNYNDPLTDYDTFLPRTVAGVLKTNIKTLPGGSWFNLREVYEDDTYWTGEVPDPENWQDDYWDGLDFDPTGKSPRVNRDLMKTWLDAHPGARFY